MKRHLRSSPSKVGKIPFFIQLLFIFCSLELNKTSVRGVLKTLSLKSFFKKVFEEAVRERPDKTGGGTTKLNLSDIRKHKSGREKYMRQK